MKAKLCARCGHEKRYHFWAVDPRKWQDCWVVVDSGTDCHCSAFCATEREATMDVLGELV